MAEIIPAILPKAYGELRGKMGAVNGLVPLVQIDVCDGSMTSSKSWPYIGDSGEFASILSGESDFPFPEELDFEVDLMVRNPENVIEDWIIAGAKRIVAHFEGMDDVEKTVRVFREKTVLPENALLRNYLGIAFEIGTPNEKILPFIADFDFVQFMGIDKIGFQGQSFDEKVLDKIKELKEKFPEAVVSVDGGVSLETAPRLIEVGADRLVIGSAIFESGDVAEAIKEFEELV